MHQEKTFYEQDLGGKIKYTVNYHDGVKTHKDGNPFFDIAIFKNKKKVKAFIKDIQTKGYTQK